MKTALATLGFCLAIASSAHAALIDFVVEWEGINGSSATASASLTLDDAVFVNPSNMTFVPAAVLGITAFSMTVTGTIAGGADGTFGIGDFGAFILRTGADALDLSQELVGQASGGGTWGTNAGDFNVDGMSSGVPIGVGPFVFQQGNDFLSLTSFRPVNTGSEPIPEPSAALLFALGLGTVGCRRRLRRS